MKIKFLAVLLGVSASVAFANEGAAPVTNEYGKKSAELRNLETKIADATNQVNAAIEAKEKTDDPEQKHVQMEAMVKAHKDLEDLNKKYNKLRLELTYRFPGHGAETEGRYKQHTTRSLEEMTHANSLDAQLSKTKQAVDKKYAPFVGRPEAPPAALLQTEKPMKAEEEKRPLRLEQ